MDLPDINVWIALIFPGHPHNVRAFNWFQSVADDGCTFCRFSMLGFLRVSTQIQSPHVKPLTMTEAWDAYDQLRSDQRVVFSEEPANILSIYRQYTTSNLISPKVWSDAYLAAFAFASGFRLVTSDTGFSKFPGLNVYLLP